MRVSIIFILTLFYIQGISQYVCDTASKNQTNLGVYGAFINDVTFSKTDNRLFLGLEGPYSLFISDDTAKSFYPAFKIDSLEFNCGEKGWGGGANKVLTNDLGWVGALVRNEGTNQPLIISFSNGDTNTWGTAMDYHILKKLGPYETNEVLDFTLNNHNFITACGPYVVVINSKYIDSSEVMDIRDYSSIFSDSIKIWSIASANNLSAYPTYIAVDSTNNPRLTKRDLYKVDSVGIYKLTLPDTINKIVSVHVPLSCISGDTLYVHTYDSTLNSNFLYHSFNGGQSWSFVHQYGLEYIESSVKLISSNKLQQNYNLDYIVLLPSNGYSTNYGNSWIVDKGTEYLYSINPSDTNIMVFHRKNSIKVSNQGINGKQSFYNNKGLESIEIYESEGNSNKTAYYVTTSRGVAYTTAYNDTNVEVANKWQSPYGEYPLIINNAIGDTDYYSIAINPYDTNNVVLGGSSGFAYTLSGTNGFYAVNPTNYSDPYVQDIAFIDSNTVLAVTNQFYSGLTGNIWKSTNKGQTWVKLSVSGFDGGNCITTEINGTDTVIYIGAGKESSQGNLWKSVDKGFSWNNINGGLLGNSQANLPILDIQLLPGQVDTLILAGGNIKDGIVSISVDGGLLYNTITAPLNIPYFQSILLNKVTDSITFYASSGNKIYYFDVKNDNHLVYYTGLPGEEIHHLTSGSLLAATTTGFFYFDLEPIDDLVSVSVPEFDSVIKCNIYPTVTNNLINIRFYKNIRKCEIILHDQLGRVHYKSSMLNSSYHNINISKLNPGIYYLQVRINSHTIYYKKIIKL